MAPTKVGIIDYGMGNLRSVAKAIERLGGRVYVGHDISKLAKMDRLVLPGVGAFGAAMKELRKRHLVSFLQKWAKEEKPLLGICLGLQLFFEKSEESPREKGLGILKGKVIQFKGKGLRIPLMGWNETRQRRKSPLLKGIKDKSFFYFVHSYYAKPQDKSCIASDSNYGIAFPAILSQGNLAAAQFHPEKSQKAGLQLLKNFINLC